SVGSLLRCAPIGLLQLIAVYACMASKVRRRYGDGLQLVASALVLLFSSLLSCSGSGVADGAAAAAAAGASSGTSSAHSHQLKDTKDKDATTTATATATAASVAGPSDAPVDGTRKSAMGAVRMFDFSFSELGPGSHLPADIVTPHPSALLDEQQDSDLQKQQQQDDACSSPPPSALSLRECSLGNEGLAEMVRSPWVIGAAAARAISLRHNQVAAAGVRALLESLRSSDVSGDRLSCLELDFNPIGDAGVQPLPAYLKERAARGGGGLEELSLRFCDIGPAGCRYLSSALLKSAAAARTSVGGGGAGGGVGGAFAKDQAEIEVESGEAEGTGGIVVPVSDAVLSRPVASGIRRLLLTGNDRLGDAGARALASALKKDRSLELLDLTRCNIGDDGARFLADALRCNSSLRELRLGYNHISAEGASALASLLYAGSSSVLESLELQGNRIGDAGALALANGFAGRGGITSAAAAAAAGGSRRRDRRGGAKQQARPGSGLRSLNLAGNGIGCSGGVALAEALLNGGRKTTGGEGCVLEDLELAGNALTLSAAQAAQAKKNSSLYKSAGGALSSLLNTFVDESYYSNRGSSQGAASASTAPSSSWSSSLADPTGGEGGVAAPRCAVAELGSALAGQGGGGGRGGKGSPSLKVLGLGRTGLSGRDAARLAATLRARPMDSPLEKVEVGMNGISAKACEAVRLAVESPTGPDDRSSKADDFETGGRGRRQRERERHQQEQQPQQKQQQQQKRQQQQRRRRPRGGDDAASAAPGSTAEQARSRGAAAAASSDERAARGEVGEYVPPGGSVELGMFGKNMASFHQARGAGSELDIEVFGKRVRFARPAASSAVVDESEDELRWSDDDGIGDGVDFDDVSNAATYGSASSWSSDEEDGGDGSDSNDGDAWDTDPGDDSDDFGGGGGGGSSAGDDHDDDGNRDTDSGSSGSGSGSGSGSENVLESRTFDVRGGGGSGSGEYLPTDRADRRRRRRQGEGEGAGGGYNDHGDSEKGFERVASRETTETGGCGSDNDDDDTDDDDTDDGDTDDDDTGDTDDNDSDNDNEWAAGFEQEAPEEARGRNGEYAAGCGAAASAEKMEREVAFDGPSHSSGDGTENGEWSAGSEAVSENNSDGGDSSCYAASGGSAASADKMEWEAGF
ncbi:unnamed protein product, partial [Pylaiella littoralis]